MRLIFDFDGVLLESEWAGNAQIADWLTASGHPTSVEEAMDEFMGLAGLDFIGAIERWIGRPAARRLPRRPRRGGRARDRRRARGGGGRGRLHPRPAARSAQGDLLVELDPLGRAAISPISASTDAFGGMIFSGREHVARGKPAPDLYLHAAAALGVPIGRIAIIEDSPVGVDGALASGAEVIGLVAGRHCLPGHAERLRALGVRHIARDFDEVAALARLELVAAAVALGGEIGAVVDAFARPSAARCSTTSIPSASSAADLPRDCWSAAGSASARQLRQHPRRDREVALVVLEAEPEIGVDRVEALVLQRIGAQLVDQADAAPLLPQIEQDAPAGRGDRRAARRRAAVRNRI